MLSLATVGIVSSILGIGVWTYVILQEGYRVEIAIVLSLTIAASLASVGFVAYAKQLRN